MCSHSHEEFHRPFTTNRKHGLLHVRLFYQSSEAFISNINILFMHVWHRVLSRNNVKTENYQSF